MWMLGGHDQTASDLGLMVTTSRELWILKLKRDSDSYGVRRQTRRQPNGERPLCSPKWFATLTLRSCSPALMFQHQRCDRS